MNFSESDARADEAMGLEAAEWLLRLDDSDPEGWREFPDLRTRNQAFFDWIGQSPDHLRVFLETLETHRRMPLIDADRLIEVEQLLKRRFADVIQLPQTMRQKARVRAARGESDSPSRFTRGRKFGIAAGILLCVLSAGGYWWSKEAGAFTTSVGEQRTAKLEDGSFIYLNTDSRIEVDFSNQARNVRLVRGEALFVVERDSSRPFTVTAGDTTVRALGTQFNVRRRAEGADVAVVEGAVQVTAKNEPEKLVAGETTKVVRGRIAQPARNSLAEAVAWRERRLVFHDARLADVAAEFNRYNRTKVRIEGDAAQDVLLSGIFDADRPQALMLYAAKSAEFAVEPEGNDWVIRGR
jgi:transmembrane sensor